MEVDESPEVTAGVATVEVPTAEEEEPTPTPAAPSEEEAVPKDEVQQEPSSTGVLRSILSEEEVAAIPAETTRKIEGHYEQKLEEFLTAKALCETAKTNVGKHFWGLVRIWGYFFRLVRQQKSHQPSLLNRDGDRNFLGGLFVWRVFIAAVRRVNFDQFGSWFRVRSLEVRSVCLCLRRRKTPGARDSGFVLVGRVLCVASIFINVDFVLYLQSNSKSSTKSKLRI